MSHNSEEKYFVGSDGEEPHQLYFDPISAYVSGWVYLDCFNEVGEIVGRYKFINNEYTEDF